MSVRSPLDLDHLEYDYSAASVTGSPKSPLNYDHGLAALRRGAASGRGGRDDAGAPDCCCCYPLHGKACVNLCFPGCPLIAHVAGRSALIVWDAVVATLSMIEGVLMSSHKVLVDYATTEKSIAHKLNLSAACITLSFIAFICFLIAFCLACVFLASLSWLQGVREEAAKSSDGRLAWRARLYNRKDTILNIILFSIHAAACLISMVAMACPLSAVRGPSWSHDHEYFMVACVILSCSSVVIQPIKQAAGQTLCVNDY